jgi:hypothetical protein
MGHELPRLRGEDGVDVLVRTGAYRAVEIRVA